MLSIEDEKIMKRTAMSTEFHTSSGCGWRAHEVCVVHCRFGIPYSSLLLQSCHAYLWSVATLTFLEEVMFSSLRTWYVSCVLGEGPMDQGSAKPGVRPMQELLWTWTEHEQWLGHFIMEISILYYLASMNIYLVSKDINLVMKINLRLLWVEILFLEIKSKSSL